MTSFHWSYSDTRYCWYISKNPAIRTVNLHSNLYQPKLLLRQLSPILACVCVCVQCSVFYFCSMVGCQMRESFHLKWLVPSCSSTHQFLLDVCNHQPTSTIIFKIYVLQISIVTSMIHSFNSWNSLFWLVEFRTNPFLIPFQSRQRDALFLWVAVH